jgi:hypothetical protein
MSDPRNPDIDGDAALRFIELFGGLERIRSIGAFGTGKGEWVKRPLLLNDVRDHLRGHGPGIGVPPLCSDNRVAFAAIDLDEPDFDAAREMQGYLPGHSYVERSRSGNAHVLAFFREPLDAWVAMALMKEAIFAAGKEGVEVFPKNHDFERVRLGSYINLPYFGDTRPILYQAQDGSNMPMALSYFIEQATETRNDPNDWRKRADWMQLVPPDDRRAKAEFGTKPTLHMCAEHVIAMRDENPVTSGHRNAVFFALAKQLTNCSLFDHDEALDLMRLVNESADDKPTPRTPDSELRRILGNAERGQYTSTGCDDPLFLPYAHPDCPIAHGS